MTQQLRLKNDFLKILKTYEASKESQQLLAKARVALFDGPSASGRNTIIYNLVKTGRYQQTISDTTRAIRSNNGVLEQNGVEYWFKTEEEFLEGLKAGSYIEAAVIHDQQVSGVNFAEIARATKSDKIAINDVQPDGIEAFRKYKPDTLCFFVIPPSFEVWEARLNARGAMTDAEKKRRYTSATKEIQHALEADYYKFIVNDNLETATNLIDQICQGTDIETTTSRNTAGTLLKEIEEHLLAEF